MKRERMNVDKTWQPYHRMWNGIRKSSTSAGMLTWCHNLDIEKGGATIWT